MKLRPAGDKSIAAITMQELTSLKGFVVPPPLLSAAVNVQHSKLMAKQKTNYFSTLCDFHVKNKREKTKHILITLFLDM